MAICHSHNYVYQSVSMNVVFQPLKKKDTFTVHPPFWKFRIHQVRRKSKKISFGGIPSSRNVLFLQIFLKRAAKPSAGKPQLGFRELKLTWLCAKASQTFSGTFSGTLLNLIWLCTKASWNLLPNLLRNLLWYFVEPDVALHPSIPDLLGNLRNPVAKPPRPSPEPSEPSPEHR